MADNWDRVTMAIVALPILIVTSYVLYQRCKFHPTLVRWAETDDGSSDLRSGEKAIGATAWGGIGA